MTMHATASPATLKHLEPSSVPWPPHKPLIGSEKGSFAEGTIKERLGKILDSTLADMAKVAGESGDDTAAQLHNAVAEIQVMRCELGSASTSMPHDLDVPPNCSPELATCITATNEMMSEWRKRTEGSEATWLTLPWLTVECYMYVRLAVALNRQPILASKRFDPFGVAKMAAFDKSRESMSTLAVSLLEILKGSCGKEKLVEVLNFSLWGNKTDLSLLIDASKIDPAKLAQQKGASGQQSPFLIVDESDGVWNLLSSNKPSATKRRIDIILDNSGLELYSDLILADYLIQAKLADSIRFHGKRFAWFVSDVTREDFDLTLDLCLASSPAKDWESVQHLAKRWKGYVSGGIWAYTDHPFWTTPAPFAWMAHLSPDLYASLSEPSSPSAGDKGILTILKGDLNYRKLTNDCRWPFTTSFKDSLQGFAPAPLLSLRTLKADVIAGLSEGQGEMLGTIDKDWQVNGKFGMIQSSLF
jgi:hypothetical protein